MIVTKLILFSLMLLSIYGLIQLPDGTIYDNVDYGRANLTYDLTSQFLRITFADNCKVSNNNDEQTFYGKIILVIWDEAESNGCYLLTQVLDQTDKMYNPEVSIVTSATSLKNYNLNDMQSEPFGEVMTKLSTAITLITNQTALNLLYYPPSTSISITSSPTSITIFYASPLWLAINWIIFSVFLIIGLYGLRKLYLSRKRWQGYLFISHVFNIFTCILILVQTGTESVKYNMRIFWLTLWCSVFTCVVCMVLICFSWLKLSNLIQADAKLKALIYFQYFILTILVTLFTVMASSYILQFPAYFNTIIGLSSFLGVLTFIGVGMMCYLGLRASWIIRQDLSQSALRRGLLVRNHSAFVLQSLTMLILNLLQIGLLVAEANHLYTLRVEFSLSTLYQISIGMSVLTSNYFFQTQKSFEKAIRPQSNLLEGLISPDHMEEDEL